MSARWVIVIFGLLTLGVLIDIAASNASFTYAYLTGQCSKSPLPAVCTQPSYFGIAKSAPPPAPPGQ
jgi:hypothetical protein